MFTAPAEATAIAAVGAEQSPVFRRWREAFFESLAQGIDVQHVQELPVEGVFGRCWGATTEGEPHHRVYATVQESVNGNLARVLLATWRLQEGSADHTGNQTLLDAGLSWLDSLCDQQAEIQTSKGNAGGYWGAGYPVTGPRGSIYFGDTGTAVTALALGWHLFGPRPQRLEPRGRQQRRTRGGGRERRQQ